MTLPRAEEIIDRYMAGEVLKEIARDYGVSRQRVHQILTRHGVTAADQYAALDRRIAMWHAEGLDTLEIARLVGRSDGWVQASMRRQGLRANRMGREPAIVEAASGPGRGRPRSLTPEQVQEVIRLHLSGMTYREIGERFGVADQTVSRYAVRAGHRSMTRKG